jgi:cytochrome P450
LIQITMNLLFSRSYFRYNSTLKLLQMTFVEISRNQEIQLQLISEVEQTIKELNGGLVTSAALRDMRLLELVILETLRKNPPIKCGTRICTKNCSITTVGGEHFKFVKGDLIHLQFDLMQNDKKFFRHPEMFDPFRFENDSTNHPLLAFGLGPRSCLGTKFVLIQAKFLIFSILSKYSVKPCDKTPKNCDENLFFELSLRK